MIRELQHAKSLDPYEEEALEGGIDAVGAYIESISGKTELSEFTDTERLELIRVAWLGCADRLREIVAKKEAPF